MTEENKTKGEKIEYIEEDFAAASRKVRKLRKILKMCKHERQEYLTGWQRARADHQNYIKQEEAKMQEFLKFAAGNIILQLIPILDNLSVACGSVPENIVNDNWAKGIEQIRKQFENILKANGVRDLEVKVGNRFDPMYHEAVGEVEGGGESGTIAEVLQKGYNFNGKIVRAAKVKVIK